MVSLSIDFAYSISVTILLLSTILACLELASITDMYLDFVFPEIDIPNKKMKWKVLNYFLVIIAILSGIFHHLSEEVLFKVFFTINKFTLTCLFSIRKISKDGSDQIRLISCLVITLCLFLEVRNGKLIPMLFIGM